MDNFFVYYFSRNNLFYRRFESRVRMFQDSELTNQRTNDLQNIGTMLKTHFSASQFIVVSLKEGMFNNANVIFRTKFVDGVSTVSRAANRSAISGKPGAASSGNGSTQESAAWKRGKTVSRQAETSRRGEENLEED